MADPGSITHKKTILNEAAQNKMLTHTPEENLLKSAIPLTKVYICSSDVRFPELMNHTQQDLKQAMCHFLEMSVGLFHWSFQRDCCLIRLS